MAHAEAATSKMADLFDPEPKTWGLRGPWVWRALCERLADMDVPASADEAVSLLLAAFRDLVGLDLESDPAPSVYREQFAHGGMSNGMVCLDTWRQKLMPLLARRAKAILQP